jgi:hypothetical protein
MKILILLCILLMNVNAELVYNKDKTNENNQVLKVLNFNQTPTNQLNSIYNDVFDDIKINNSNRTIIKHIEREPQFKLIRTGSGSEIMVPAN